MLLRIVLRLVWMDRKKPFSCIKLVTLLYLFSHVFGHLSSVAGSDMKYSQPWMTLYKSLFLPLLVVCSQGSNVILFVGAQTHSEEGHSIHLGCIPSVLLSSLWNSAL